MFSLHQILREYFVNSSSPFDYETISLLECALITLPLAKEGDALYGNTHDVDLDSNQIILTLTRYADWLDARLSSSDFRDNLNNAQINTALIHCLSQLLFFKRYYVKYLRQDASNFLDKNARIRRITAFEPENKTIDKLIGEFHDKVSISLYGELPLMLQFYLEMASVLTASLKEDENKIILLTKTSQPNNSLETIQLISEEGGKFCAGAGTLLTGFAMIGTAAVTAVASSGATIPASATAAVAGVGKIGEGISEMMPFIKKTLKELKGRLFNKDQNQQDSEELTALIGIDELMIYLHEQSSKDLKKQVEEYLKDPENTSKFVIAAQILTLIQYYYTIENNTLWSRVDNIYKLFYKNLKKHNCSEHEETLQLIFSCLNVDMENPSPPKDMLLGRVKSWPTFHNTLKQKSESKSDRIAEQKSDAMPNDTEALSFDCKTSHDSVCKSRAESKSGIYDSIYRSRAESKNSLFFSGSKDTKNTAKTVCSFDEDIDELKDFMPQDSFEYKTSKCHK